MQALSGHLNASALWDSSVLPGVVGCVPVETPVI